MPGRTMPVSEARTTAWTRSRRLSLARRRPTWVLTVVSLTTRCSAISALDMPLGTRPGTPSSRGGRGGEGAGGGGPGGRGGGEVGGEAVEQPPGHRGAEQGVAGGHHLDRLDQVLGGGGGPLSRNPLPPARGGGRAYSRGR